METFKNYINSINGLRFIYENLKINSGIGRKYLLNLRFCTEKCQLKSEFDNIDYILNFINNNSKSIIIDKICNILQDINDIHSTINNLKNKRILDDIELFETKKFCILSQKISGELTKLGVNFLRIHDLSGPINILDPEKSGIISFYIYSIYDPRLAELRKKEKLLSETDPVKAEEIRLQSIELEDCIRQDLSSSLSVFASELQTNLETFAYLDVLIAKAFQAKELDFCKPQISLTEIKYRHIFNPQIKELLNFTSKKYQPVDIEIYNEPCLITGANMSGKTVLLKTIALAQILFQFGFYIPARSAIIKIFDKIMLSIGDDQSELNGLSSFAVEMLNINNIIKEVKSGKKVLALVDELARTTNPEEGKALVNAFLDIMTEFNVHSLITTHYSGIISNVRRLRVKGLIINNKEKISVNNINEFMDYSLVETTSDEVPMEAIKIAEIFDVDQEFIIKTRHYLNKTD